MRQTQLTFEAEVLSVSAITNEIKNVLERTFSRVMVEGETSNVKMARSGHIYFTLKDDEAQIPCVMWRSVATGLQADLADGQQVIVSGNVDVYPPHGKYQLIVKNVKQAGLGALQAAFEKLKQRLEKEGLFKKIHKKKLPKFPQTIGVVTSATGAAFHDIQSTLNQRFPLANVVLYHASVQGVQATPELVKAIQYFNTRDDIDVLIVGRGGGSLEDLWPFNEEAVARAVFASAIPIISAVGHEVDYSISDFVADARAATPTHAAVVATPDKNELLFYIDDIMRSMDYLLEERMNRYKEELKMLKNSYAFGKFNERLVRLHESIERKAEKLGYLVDKNIQQKKSQFTEWMHRLDKNNPDLPLLSGYTRVYQNGKWVKQAKQFDVNMPLAIEWQDKQLTLEVKS